MISLLFRDNNICLIAICLCMWFMITNQLLQQDKYCDIIVEDELWSSQWYLNKKAMTKYDMNILPAWKSCINGTGVTVGVVDNGVQDHVDLNINRQIGFGIGHTTINSLRHGTRVAGVIGALKNTDFTVGIAFGSVIADIQIASTEVYESFNETALIHQLDIIDVYSCSFANSHTGVHIYDLTTGQEDAFSLGTTRGRDRLGCVYVFATGNNGDESDMWHYSCAYDRLVSNRYVISVAGIQHNLSKVPSGEACSAMMVAAFTAEGGEQTFKLVTTDVENKSTDAFNQNSAATPMVSGAVALALSANQRLSYRDVMHLLVLTSRADLPEFEHGNYFMRNAANLSVSSYFGFGLLDIGGLVERSMAWKSVPALKMCTVKSLQNMTVDGLGYLVYVDACEVTYCEHVEVSLMVTDQNAGNMAWYLVSPYGTRSKIIPGRMFDSRIYMNITVLTVQMWGENPKGYWMLQPHGYRTTSATVVTFSLHIFGFTCMSDFKCLQPADQELSSFLTPQSNVTVGAVSSNISMMIGILIAFILSG